MKVYFGSIEYFEQEIQSLAKRKSFMDMSPNQIMEIHSEIKDELINDFICDADVKRECINNLNLAAERFLYKYQTMWKWISDNEDKIGFGVSIFEEFKDQTSD